MRSIRQIEPQATARLNNGTRGLAKMPRAAPIELTTNPEEERQMAVTTVIDVRTEPPARRHQLIFTTFDELAVGSAFELVNDHDPKPLRYQLEAEQTAKFTWEYLEQGPSVWRVKIGRTAA